MPHFVADDPPPALVERAARAYLASDGEIRTVLRTIFRSPEFWSRAAFRTRLKNPFELVASTVRALAAPPDTTARTLGQLAYLGQPIWGQQTPNGWPDVASGWLGSDAMIRRMNFGLNAAAGALPGTSLEAWRREAALELPPAPSRPPSRHPPPGRRRQRRHPGRPRLRRRRPRPRPAEHGSGDRGSGVVAEAAGPRVEVAGVSAALNVGVEEWKVGRVDERTNRASPTVRNGCGPGRP